MTTVAVTVESRYLQTPDGSVWTFEGPAYSFFERYLTAFDRVEVIARVKAVTRLPAPGHLVSGPKVHFHRIPHYQGPREFVTAWAKVRSSLKASVSPDKSYIFRVPSTLASILATILERRNIPYAIEVMGDPYDVFAPGVVNHPLRPILRTFYTRRLRHLAATAAGVSYVTDAYLQRRYPAGRSAVTSTYSSIELSPASIASSPRTYRPGRRPARISSVGTLDQLYKGVDTLIEAVHLLRNEGTEVEMVHVGDGIYRSHLEALIRKLALDNHVRLIGRLPAGEAVRAELDRSDLFVMPSRTEGLPKALLEAMARGLPAVGTSVGGIPELLPQMYLVPPNDAASLATAISRMLANPADMLEAAKRNLLVASRFEASELAVKRQAFYTAVRNGMCGAHT